MSATVVTIEDLVKLKNELIEEFKKIISSDDEPTNTKKLAQPTKWLKSHQVQRLLSISPGTLETRTKNLISLFCQKEEMQVNP